jgi:aryl-alcohol dehydrogenase-like predicted oxidoreductase
MQTRSLGTSEIQITPIIMGTWQAGKKMWVGIEDADTIKAIRAAFDAGITTVDTAEVYGEGHSEQIVALPCQMCAIKQYMPQRCLPTISSMSKL